MNLADFYIPTKYQELELIIKISRVMLQTKQMKSRAEREKFVPGKVAMPVRQQECRSFQKPRALKTKGPAPPKSWQSAWYFNNNYDGKIPDKTKINSSSSSFYSKLLQKRVIKERLKKKKNLGCIFNPLSDDLLHLFSRDCEYEEMDLSNSLITFECFKRNFWKEFNNKNINKSLNIVENWEDLLSKDDGDGNGNGNDGGDDQDIELISKQYLCHNSINNNSNSSNDNESLLTKKYLTKFRKLKYINLGFSNNLATIPMASLLVSTLPLLTHLSIAGCFDANSGPIALNIFSNLINLLFWDLSYCGWINDKILAKAINWEINLKSLKVLVLIECGKFKDLEGLKHKLINTRRLLEIWTDNANL
nr:7496_t:CDS:2 [Entrophospora candida]